GPVRLRRVGRREHDGIRLLTALAQLPEPLDRTAERELRAAEALDEVAAAAQPQRLERAQVRVDRAVASGDALRAHAVTRDDPLPLEQQLRERAPVGRAAEEAGGERPAALRGRGPGRTAAREPPW